MKILPIGMALMVLSASFTFSACSSSERSAEAGSKKALIVYSGRSDKFMQPVVKAFTEKTGVEVTLHTAKSTAMLKRLELEGQATSADLFISNDAGNLGKGSALGLFQEMDSQMTSVISAAYRDADNRWAGVSARARIIVVNKTRAADEGLSFVKNIEDLADLRLSGKLGITSSANGSFIAGVSVYQKKWGDAKTAAWLEGLKRNAQGDAYPKHSKVVNDVAAGKKAVGLVNHYYVLRHLQKNPDADLKIIVPDQSGIGVAVNVAGVAIVKPSKQANQFVEFLLSNAGQKIFADVNQEMPVSTGVAVNQALAAAVPGVAGIRIADVPMQALATMRDSTLALINQVQLP